MDPRECKSDKDFKTKYNLAFAFAQVSQEMIDLLSEETLTAKIKDILAEIEREKLLDNSSYTLEGVEYGKK